MKKIKFSVIALLGINLLMSCNKSTEVDPPLPNISIKQTDMAGAAEIDNVLGEVNNIISNEIGGGASKASQPSPIKFLCDSVAIDSAELNTSGNKIYSINYDTAKCTYRHVTGEISFQLQNNSKFNDAGAIYDITFTNYKAEIQITPVVTSVIILNGTLTITNLDGGYIWQSVTDNATIRHKIRGTVNITYANGRTRPRSYFQIRTWTPNNSWKGLTFTITGDSTSSSKIISETGRTFEGNYPFTTEILTDFVWQNCDENFQGTYKAIKGHSILNVTGATVFPATVDVEAGYNWNSFDPTSTPVKEENCNANAYKVISKLSVNTITSCQVY